jgi:pSer/pThr/pTyr-binding forkhead associated (FHA) protein
MSTFLQLRFQDRIIPLRAAETIIGRSIYCSFIIGHPSVSRVHLAVRRKNGQTFVHDLGSRNGTTLNGATVGPKSVPITVGDSLQIGDVKCRVETYDDKEPMATTDRPSASSEDTTQRLTADIWRKPGGGGSGP